jgi:hypothetical protein
MLDCFNCQIYLLSMARNFGHARAVNIKTWKNLKQNGYAELYRTLKGVNEKYGLTFKL